MAGIYIVGQSGTLYKAVGSTYTETINEETTMYAGFNNVFPGSCYDVSGIVGVLTPQSIIERLLASSFVGQDGAGFGNIYFQLLQFLLRATDASVSFDPVDVSIVEAIWSWDLPFPSALNYDGAADAIQADDTLLGAYTRVVLESVGITGAVSGAVAELIAEVFRALGAAGTSLSGHSLVAEVLKAVVAVRLAFPVPINDVFTASALLTLQRLVGLSIADKAAVMGGIANKLTALGLFEDLVGLSEFIISGKGAEAMDILTIRATLFALLTGRPLLQDTAGLSAQAQGLRRLLISVSDKAVIIDPPSGELFDPTQLLNILVTEQIKFRVGWIADDGLYEGYVINTNTNAVSQYQGWDFNSFAEFYGAYLAASSTQGLARLGGAQDGPNLIKAALQTAVTDFGSGHQKRVRSAYLGIAAEGTCYLQVLTDDNTERTYQLVANAPGLGNERVDLARGVQSRYWSFSLKSVDGSAWRLDNLEVLPVVLSRRVR